MRRLAFKAFLALLLILLGQHAFAAQIKLGWVDPTTNTDGTLLTDLAGYKVYYGTAAGVYGQPIDVPLDAVVINNGVTTYTLTGLTDGQAYFIFVTARNSSNPSDESDPSNEVVWGIFAVATNPPGLQVVVDSVSYQSPQAFGYAADSSHLVSVASPQAGAEGSQYVYNSWSDGGAQDHTITVSSTSMTYTANFTTQYSLTTSVNVAGAGIISPSGPNWYDQGQSVSVSATANAGYSFSNWTGDLSGSTNPASVTMNGPRSVTANFSQDQYSLTVNGSPSGGGSVTKNLSQPTYIYGDQVQLTATANPGYTFSGWSGDASGTANPVTITMDGNKAVTASFTQNQYTLGISIGPSGVGSVSKSPDKTTYVYGDQVQLTATANPGYTFSGWSGGASGTANPVTVTMNGNTAITANFLYALQVSLKAGYNLVSFPTIAGDIAITDLLSSISGQFTKAYAYEGCDPAGDYWKIYDPALPPYANDLQVVDSTMGIWVEVNQDVELTTQGLFSSTLSIPLCVGWNLISYAGEQAKAVAEALSSISGKYDRVYSYRADDTADPWKVYDVSVPSYVNDLVTMEPGVGYWIHVSESCTLVINN